MLIDEIIGGGDGLAYKARRNDADARNSLKSRIGRGIKKILGIKSKNKIVDPNAPPPVLTREQQDMADMDRYYTNYNHELPDQKPMALPPKVRKPKSSTGSTHNLPSSSQKDVASSDKVLPLEKEIVKSKRAQSNAPDVSFAAGALSPAGKVENADESPVKLDPIQVGETPPKDAQPKLVDSIKSLPDEKPKVISNLAQVAVGI